jgi:hypothetical protein
MFGSMNIRIMYKADEFTCQRVFVASFVVDSGRPDWAKFAIGEKFPIIYLTN